MKAFPFARAFPSLIVALSLIAVSQAHAQESKTVRLLTVGNSFSRNATRFLGDLAKAAGHELVHESIVVGGASLELHAGRALIHQENPEAKEGLYSDDKSLVQHLKSGDWDVVTIQQASIKSHDYATFQPHGRQLADFIRKHAPNAKLMIHQTWAYRSDDSRFSGKQNEPGGPANRQQMHEWLTAAYDQLARDVGAAGVIPVGDAFALVENDPKRGFKPDTTFDRKGAVAPKLPNQRHSLHVGWRWVAAKDGGRELKMDGHHANLAGEFLGACVWYEVLFGDSCLDNAFLPEGLDADFARVLRESAHRVVQARRQAEPAGR